MRRRWPCIVVAVLTTFLFAGCAVTSAGIAKQKSGVDFGPYPEEYQEIIRRDVGAGLRDPYSAVWTYTTPQEGWRNVFGKRLNGWLVCGTLNAKNAFGGYVGARPYTALLRDGRVIGGVLYSSDSPLDCLRTD